MMDLKEIIKWFIPCFHILLVILKDRRLTFICLFLLFNFRVSSAANVKSVEIIGNHTKNLNSLMYESRLKVNQSDVKDAEVKLNEVPDFSNRNKKSFAFDGSVGRTFGRPFKKMMGALIPVIFQIGAASTWAVVAALVGVKTLAVTLLILKILLLAGAAKALAVAEKAVINDRRQAMRPLPLPLYRVFRHVVMNGTNETRLGEWVPLKKIGALFGSKLNGHYPHPQAWESHPPQKEIHLHIHNGHHESQHHDEHGVYGPWSREDATNDVNIKPTALDPYSIVGPQTIRTPFGNYVKVESNNPLPHPGKRK